MMAIWNRSQNLCLSVEYFEGSATWQLGKSLESYGKIYGGSLTLNRFRRITLGAIQFEIIFDSLWQFEGSQWLQATKRLSS